MASEQLLGQPPASVEERFGSMAETYRWWFEELWAELEPTAARGWAAGEVAGASEGAWDAFIAALGG